MKKSKRYFGYFAAAMLGTAMLLTACGGTKKAESGAAGTMQAAAETDAAETPLPAAAKITARTFTAHSASMYVKDNTGTGVRVREYPSTNAKIIATLQANEAVNVTGTADDGWSEVEISGKKYYMASRYLTDRAAVRETKESGSAAKTGAAVETAKQAQDAKGGVTETEVSLSGDWKYANFSKIHTGTARLYQNRGGAHGSITVCVNAGHGTSGGESVKTQSHPDGTGKVTGGTNANGAKTSMAVSSGMEFTDGTEERKVTLAEAKILKQKLLDAGYSVLMIRESDDVQLDNIARTVIANNTADCHIAVHWDSTGKDKGAFVMLAPAGSYRNMEPVASTWQKSEKFGRSLISGLRNTGFKIFGDGTMGEDLTQISYSTIPSVDIELGDRASDHSDAVLSRLADGMVAGVNAYFNGQ